MKENEIIFQRQKFNTRFKNSDMDFMFNWAVGVGQLIGMAPSQIFYAVHGIKDGDPTGWREGLSRQAGLLIGQAKTLLMNNQPVAAGQAYLGAAYAYRAAIQYTSPKSQEFMEWAREMEHVFQEGIHLLNVPMCPIEVPFEGKSLAGYYLEHDDQARPVVVMIGGGDTFREDLFYFAGYPGWKRGYNVIMVDLPGQGLMPARGLPFQVDMAAPIKAVLDWLEMHTAARSEKIAIYGVSGGGYFTTQAAAVEPRIKAWIAATPIYDLQIVFKREMGAALRAPGWAVNTVLRLAGSVNESAAINLEKYAWQFGMPDFKSAADALLKQAEVVDYTRIHCPSLILVSEGEGAELQRQSRVVAQNLAERGIPVALRDFTAGEGADAHCQLNNLRLAHLVIFDWLDRIFEHDSGDVRLRC
jgi:alpha-beta hydrolase superfamily lysophospholipase